jgi:hypothetical protein
MTPHSVHCGHADAIRLSHQLTLDAALLAHPKGFVAKEPQPHAPPTAAWINPPPSKTTTTLKKRNPAPLIHDAGGSRVIDTFRPIGQSCAAEIVAGGGRSRVARRCASWAYAPLVLHL